MASKVRVRMRAAGSRAVLKDPAIQAHLLSIGSAVARSAGKGFVADVQPGRTRARSLVKTTDRASREKNARTNALLKGLGAGR